MARPAKIDGLRRWQIETVGLSSPARRLAFSPDGKLLAVGTASGEIRLYDGGLRPVRFLHGHEGAINALSWTREGRLASAGDDKTVRIWEPDGMPGPVMRDADVVSAVAWKPDGTLLASGNNNSLLRLWQPDGTPDRVIPGHSGGVHSLSWTADGRRLASVGGDAVRIWDADGKAGPVLQLKFPTGAAWSPDGTRLAVSSVPGLGLWDADGKAGPFVQHHSHTLTSVSWSPDGRMLATGSHDGTARLCGLDLKRGPELQMTPHTPAHVVASVAWSPDSRRLATCSNDGTVRLWDSDGKAGPALGTPPSVASVSWSPDGQRLASGSRDRYVRLWGADGRAGPVLAGHTNSVESVCWSPDGQQLASACHANTPDPIRLWAADGKEGPVLRGGSAPAVWSPDGQLIASRVTGIPRGWRLWDARTNRQVGADLPVAGDSWTWSPDSQRMAEAGGHHLALLRRDGTVERTFDPSHAFAISWSPDGRHIALGNEQGTLLRTPAGDPVPGFGGGGNVLAVSWSPDSRRIASGVWDGTLRLWDIDGKAGPVLRAPGTSVLSVSWAKEGNRLAASRNDGTIRVHEAGALEPLWTAVVPRSGRAAVFSAAGQMLSGYLANADEDFVYVAQAESGRFELFTPTEFRKKALKDGRPLPLFGPETAPPSRPVDDAWVQSVRQEPLARQRDEVLARLKELNPGYYDPFEHREVNGQNVAVTLPPSAALRDLSPLRALAGLKQLTINGPYGGPPLPLSDLKPLAGLKLKELTCTGTSVADLAPLEGMPLETLNLHGTLAADLKPLRALPLRALDVGITKVEDLKPLQGIASLKSLDVRGSRVTDLKPIQGLLLESIGCDVEPKRDAPVLQAMPTLRVINNRPAGEFFARPAVRLVLEKWLQDLAPLPFEKWKEAVAALPAEKQVIAVEVKLFERNPGFDFLVGNPQIEGGVVTGIRVPSDLKDFSPLHALTGLRTLYCNNDASRGKLTDLSFVKGMKLTSLHCGENRGLTDFSPLKGLALTDLDCFATGLADLSVLKGMPLTSLRCGLTPVTDLTPLKGMKLTRLDCSRMPVKDLSPLQGMPLTFLMCNETQVTDLSPLKGMPLKQIICDFKAERDAEVLRSIKTLETINGKPVADFWKEVDAGTSGKKP